MFNKECCHTWHLVTTIMQNWRVCWNTNQLGFRIFFDQCVQGVHVVCVCNNLQMFLILGEGYEILPCPENGEVGIYMYIYIYIKKY